MCLTDGRLHSWAREHAWISAPTPEHARRCDRWALFDLGRCVDDARRGGVGRRSSPVIGLVEGRGAVVPHGEEGFVSERDSVLCLFEDSVWDGAVDAVPSRPGRWARSSRPARSACPLHERSAAVRDAACILGIPIMSMAEAIRSGALAEFGLRQPSALATSLEPSSARIRAEDTSPT